jgi:hypothetical protein
VGDRRPLSRLWRAAAPAALGGAVVAALFGPLLSPATALATRDIAFFHLPLRSDFARLAAAGPPLWNPWINGGQPLLSNPSYGAFYPPSWLVLAVSPAYALNLLVLLHAALAFAGAWVLARRLGCERGAAALAAVGYGAAGSFVALLHALTLFTSMAWFPWTLVAGDALLSAAGGRRSWWRPAAGLAGTLALQLLNGEPVTVLVSGLALLALAAGEARRTRAALRLAAPIAIALLIAAVQVLPTWQRLRDSPRAHPLDLRGAAVWSAPPARMVELALPHLFGDPARVEEEGRYFGWSLHDQQFPYVVSIYPGLLVTVLALAALLRWPIRRRAGLALAAAGGVFLALGRHNPLYDWLHRHLPLLGMVRFPEKFLLLTLGVLPFAAALGWQRLLDDRAAGRRDRGDLPLVLALAVAAAGAVVAAGVALAPAVATGFVRAGSGGPLSPEALAGALAYLRSEALASLVTAAAVALVLVLLRRRSLPAALVTSVAVCVLAGDLWITGHDLVRRLPAEEYRRPPPAARAVLASRGRLFTDEGFHGDDDLVLRQGEPGLEHLRTKLRRLDPYAANLWGIGYALDEDYDLMLTGWGRHALAALHAEWGHALRAFRLLGAWNVASVAVRLPSRELLAALAAGGSPPAAEVLDNPWVLPRYRFVAEVRFHPDAASALAAAAGEGYELARRDHWVGTAPAPPPPIDPPAPAELLAVTDGGGRIAVRYRAPAGGRFVAAVTFDAGWRATVDGEAVPLYPTALGQIGAVVPAGEHRLELAYRDRWLLPGAALSLLGLALAGGLVVAGRQRPAAAAPAERTVPAA